MAATARCTVGIGAVSGRRVGRPPLRALVGVVRPVRKPATPGVAVITEACIDVKDRACVDVSPVQCICEFDPVNNVLVSEERAGGPPAHGCSNDGPPSTVNVRSST